MDEKEQAEFDRMVDERNAAIEKEKLQHTRMREAEVQRERLEKFVQDLFDTQRITPEELATTREYIKVDAN